VLTIASWVIAAGVLVLAGWLSRRAKHPIFVCMVLASGVAALAEPLYDVMFSLYFYSGHGMQKTYTVFDIPQPVWAYSGYAILYGLPAMFIVKEIGEGKNDPEPAVGLGRRRVARVLRVRDRRQSTWAPTPTGARTCSASGTTPSSSACWRPHRSCASRWPARTCATG